jgi:hypothetical protein
MDLESRAEIARQETKLADQEFLLECLLEINEAPDPADA